MLRISLNPRGGREDEDRVREEAFKMVEKAIRLFDDGYEAEALAAYDYARGYVVNALDDEWATEQILEELNDLWENG